MLWLRFYLNPTLGGDEEFREKHANVFEPAAVVFGAPQREFDKDALQTSYQEHLVQLRLLTPRYKADLKTKQPVFDTQTGAPQVVSYRITSLGRLLLREIDLKLNDEYDDDTAGNLV